MEIKIKRAYEPATAKDGFRVLVDRLWPRGVTKEAAAIDAWEKELAPDTELRKWFGHAPEKWTAFQEKYREALKKNKLVDQFIAQHSGKKVITLIYSAKDEMHNQALVLQKYLEGKIKKLR